MERHGDRVVVFGINTDRDADEYRRLAAEHDVTWPNLWQGGTDGPVPTKWGVDSYPTVFVLDADHVIRHVNARGDRLETVVSQLVAEAEAAGGSDGSESSESSSGSD